MDLRIELRNARRRNARASQSLEESEERRRIRNDSLRERRRRESSSDRQVRLNHRRQSQTRQSVMVEVSEHDCGSLTERCNFCQALYWKGEENSRKRFTRCCHDGKVSLPSLSEVPDILMDLLCSESDEAKNFRQHIRSYNAALAFASMGAEINLPPGRGPFCFRIHGQIYHRISPLYSDESNKPGYGQLYIFDSSEANAYRMDNNKGCLQTLMEKLDTLLRSINPFAESYLQMHELIQTNQTADVKMIFMENPGLDLRRYNAPTSKTEVAAIFVGDDGEPPANRDICIYPKADNYKNISPMNQCCDPMVYPLLFPRGETGWYDGMMHVEERRSAKRVRVTQLQYYAYRLSIRSGFSILHSSGKLF